ncbi:MAG TPA: DUF3865 domain-containing protein [Candidatus Nanoarchaeia archaeon]|nr:DUF3865 domain-containing protein [Candidatus Nanoarchaeia archaeon]
MTNTPLLSLITRDNFLASLRKVMRDEYLAVNRRKNPVAVNLDTTTSDQLLYLVGQYTLFPKNIVSFLRAAQEVARANGWQAVCDELERNIGEEYGSKTEGVPHYDMLVKGISEELGHNLGYAPVADLEKKLRTLEASPAMGTFLTCMPEIVGNTNSLYAMGGTYALEASAVPELVIVRMAVSKLIETNTGIPMPRDGYLGKFFDAHLRVWEPGHEEGLRVTSATYLTSPETGESFEAGFRDTMKAMDEMWTNLYQES